MIRDLVTKPTSIDVEDLVRHKKGDYYHGSSNLEQELYGDEAQSGLNRSNYQRYGADSTRSIPLDNVSVAGRARFSNEHVFRGVCCDVYCAVYCYGMCRSR